MSVSGIIVVMVVVVVMGSGTGSLVSLVEGEGVHQGLGATLLARHRGGGDEGQKANLREGM